MNIIQKIKLNNPEKENLQKTLYEIDTLSKRWTGIQKSGESDSEAIQKNIETLIGRQIIAGKISDGQSITIDVNNGILTAE